MVKFEEYLKKYKEIGFIKKISQSIVYVEGLPGINVSEIVIFENDLLGQVYSVDEDYVEVDANKGIVRILSTDAEVQYNHFESPEQV